MRSSFAAVALGLALGAGPAVATGPSIPGTALNGMSGLIDVPSAEVLPDGVVRLGAARIDEEWAYQGRGLMHNEIYFVTFGFLPRLEVSIRATHLPEVTLLGTVGGATAVDRAGSARFLVRREGTGPAVAVGVDDVRGTRLFHSLYAVATKSVPVGRVAVKVTAGFGSDALDADRHVLDGLFGGVELRPVPFLAGVLDFDTEKWNSGVAATVFDRLTVQAVLLHLDTPSGSLAWTQRF